MELRALSFQTDDNTDNNNEAVRIIDTAKMSFGGTSAENYMDFMAVAILLQSEEDYMTLIGYSDTSTIKQRYKDIIIRKIRECSGLNDFDDVDYDEVSIVFLYKVEYATCAHTTPIKNLDSILPPGEDQVKILSNREYYGDFGHGTYFYLKDSDKAIKYIKMLVEESGSSPDKQAVLWFNYDYIKHPNIEMYKCLETDYIFCPSDVIISKQEVEIEPFPE